MSDFLYPLRVLHGKIHDKRARFSSKDPFYNLEKKGLKIAESSKKRMHSIYGIDGMAPWLIEIGENCMVSTNVEILVHDASTAIATGHTKFGRVTIGNRVFIGHASTILPGVTIGDNVIIGCNSVVTKDIPSNSVYAGNPARYICSFDEYRKRKLKEIEEVPNFDHKWFYWTNEATNEERMDMKKKMKNSRVGYIKADM